MSRLLEKYKSEIAPALMSKFSITNVMAVPKIEKIILSMGVGKATENKNRVDAAVKDLSLIAGQKPVVTLARKSVANFKLRQGERIGCKVTLRGKRMYEFLDRLINLSLPKIKDFRGLSPKGFDEAGNYNLGINEQLVFPEINIDSVEFVQGLNVAICISGKNATASYELLALLGMPFKK